MRFRFYSAMYGTPNKEMQCNSAEYEFESLEEASEFMKKGVVRQDDLGMAFIPVVCEQIEVEE